ncbi:MAG: type II secretion system protein E, partial [Veillonella sp.]|nr:type II secretion system protein E [Veillonella sp.]MDU3757427.1 type II secretion system protein E [Veillonella sp.]
MDSCCKRESLETIVENAIQLSSTDIHLQCGQPIYLRHGDGLKATSFMCTTELIEDILRRCGIASYEWQSLDEACSCCGVR